MRDPGDQAPDCGGCPFEAVEADCPFVPKPFDAHDLLLAIGERAPEVHVLRSGAVLAEAGANDTDFAGLRVPGMLLGGEVIDGRPAALGVRALTPGWTCVAPFEVVHRAARDSAPLAWALARGVAGASRVKADDLGAIGASARARVARVILALDAAGVRVTGRVLARLAGVRHETVSRTLRALRAEGLVGPGRALPVYDADGLAAVVAAG